MKNPVYHSKTNHIRRRYHFTRKAVEDGDMCLEKIEGAKNPADMLTNVLMLGNWGYAKPRLVFCSCCYRCCGAVKMLMMKRSFLECIFWMTESVSKWENC